MTVFSITADESAKLDREYESMITYLLKAIIEVGDMKMSEAIGKLIAITNVIDIDKYIDEWLDEHIVGKDNPYYPAIREFSTIVAKHFYDIGMKKKGGE